MSSHLRAVGIASMFCFGTTSMAGVDSHVFNLPTQNLAIFGVQFTVDFLGPPEGTIVQTKADLNFTTGPSFDAADIVLTFQAPSAGVPIWQFSGADLGWSGTGTFNAALTTDTLNGVIDLGDPTPDFSLFLLVIAAGGQPLGGQFSDSKFTVLVDPPPPPCDIDGDGVIGINDMLDLLAAWGPCGDCAPEACPADLDNDCTVGIIDFLQLLANWGPCPAL